MPALFKKLSGCTEVNFIPSFQKATIFDTLTWEFVPLNKCPKKLIAMRNRFTGTNRTRSSWYKWQDKIFQLANLTNCYIVLDCCVHGRIKINVFIMCKLTFMEPVCYDDVLGTKNLE